jgi:hypothetical protein
LDPAKWATARLSGEIGSSGQGVANPVAIAPIPQCRSGITQSSVFPPNDTLICDPSGARTSQLMTAVAMQNYGVNSYMIRQPFDFAGRTGKIVFDVDAVDQGLGGFIEIELTEDPTPATTFREFQNFEVGPVPRNGLTLRLGSFSECPNAVAPVNTMVYKNYVGAIITPTFNHSNGCAKTSRGSLNRFEVQVSQGRIDVFGSDFSTDNGQTFANNKLLYSASISLPFTRGYVHFNPRNHATVKYGFGPDVVFHWDNIGFDGPVIAAPRAYEIPDNTVVTSYNGNQVQNLGYQLYDGTTGKAAGIYNLSTKMNSLSFQNVNTSGITSATLTMNAFFSAGTRTASTNWGISYRFNGGTWRTRNLTAGDLASINAIAGAPLGHLSLALDVPTADLVSGNNTLELLPLNAPMDYPPVVANIDLLLGASGSSNPSQGPAPTVAFSANPTSIASGKISTMNWSSTDANSCTAAGGWTGAKAPSGTLVVSPPNSTTYMLTCTGSGGTSPAASTTVLVNSSQTPIGGVCGTANGTTVTSAPLTNLCAVGTASSMTGSGPWTWSCNGSNGGVSATCTAPAGSASGGGGGGSTPTPVAGNCGMQLGGPVSFCDTFDTKNPGIQSRTGDLDPNVWGVSRATGNTNFGPGYYNGWAPTDIQTCNGTKTVSPPNDIVICNGQLRQASNDNPLNVFDAGGVTTLAMYPKQPFDFAGRTGTVSFDISNDTHGTHAAWPEFWLSNLPIPTPFNHFATWQALPEHGLGIRFAASAAPGTYGLCPNGNNLDKRRWTVDSAVVIRNYVMDDTVGLGGVRTKMAVKQLDCVVAPSDNSGVTNHVELRISQNQIDVYATDAGVTPTPTNLKRIAVVTDANLSLTRGLIWLEDVHYNADKGEAPSQKQHTWVWDNVAFDGPFTYRDFSYDALDVNQPNATAKTVDLGKPSLPNQTASWNVLNMPANPKAGTVRVLFNFYQQNNGNALNVIVNGHAHSSPWPFPDNLTAMWRTYAVTIPITDLVPGTNVVQLGSDQAMITSNVNIVLVDVPGGVPVLPGSNNAYPASQASN